MAKCASQYQQTTSSIVCISCKNYEKYRQTYVFSHIFLPFSSSALTLATPHSSLSLTYSPFVEGQCKYLDKHPDTDTNTDRYSDADWLSGRVELISHNITWVLASIRWVAFRVLSPRLRRLFKPLAIRRPWWQPIWLLSVIKPNAKPGSSRSCSLKTGKYSAQLLIQENCTIYYMP